MLVELERPLQHANEPKRRIFLSERFDLFVWIADDGHVLAFELDYRKGPRERAVRWKAGVGCSHHGIDDGEDSPWKSNTPLLVPDGPFSRWSVLGDFQRAARRVDRAIADFVARKLAAFTPRTD